MGLHDERQFARCLLPDATGLSAFDQIERKRRQHFERDRAAFISRRPRLLRF